jgi:hypothetical protein
MMPIIVRRTHASRRQLSPYKRYELLTGYIDYPLKGYDGYGDGQRTSVAGFISDEMKADWQANRDELLAQWRADEVKLEKPWLMVISDGPDTLPWAARMFDD